MSGFDSRIIALRKEVEALKALKRKSSLTLPTITKTTTCVGSIYRYNTPLGPQWHSRMAGWVKVVPKDGNNDFLASFSLLSYSQRNNRRIDMSNWYQDGKIGVVCVPSAISSDTAIGVYNVPITVYVTATSDFNIETGQVLADDYQE